MSMTTLQTNCYLKNTDASPKRIEEVKEAGREQLGRYASSAELSAIPNLKRWVLVFAGDKCVAMDELSP